LLKNKIS